jgi:hypothetical protein
MTHGLRRVKDLCWKQTSEAVARSAEVALGPRTDGRRGYPTDQRCQALGQFLTNRLRGISRSGQGSSGSHGRRLTASCCRLNPGPCEFPSLGLCPSHVLAPWTTPRATNTMPSETPGHALVADFARLEYAASKEVILCW